MTEKTKILFVIRCLGAGGAEKSLVSLFHELDSTRYDVDLLLTNPTGLFLAQLPGYVNLLDTPTDIMYYSSSYKEAVNRHFSSVQLFRKLICSIKSKFLFKDLSSLERRWKIWGGKIKPLSKSYDVAVSYQDGMPNFFVTEKVTAKRKLLWVHNDFDFLGLTPEFEYKYFENADGVVTISELCRDSLKRAFPTLENKFSVLYNISSSSLIRSLANEPISDADLPKKNAFFLLTVGRLTSQKGQDIALDAAAILRERNFCWIFLGEGEWQEMLLEKVKSLGLEDKVKFLGVKSNPYSFMKRADLFVQSSRFEGKSIVLDEAKLLNTPILATAYPTVYDNVENEKTGFICDLTAEALAEKIAFLMDNPEKLREIKKNLSEMKFENESEIYRYESLFDGKNFE